MSRCAHPSGCNRLVLAKLALCEEHHIGNIQSACCAAQVMAGVMTDGDLVGYCSECEEIVIDRGISAPNPCIRCGHPHQGPNEVCGTCDGGGS